MSKDVSEFNLLGFDIKFSAEQGESSSSPEEIVEYVRREIEEIQRRSPNLGAAKSAVLAALNIAAKKLDSERDYQENIQFLHNTAQDALQIVEDLSPGSH